MLRLAYKLSKLVYSQQKPENCSCILAFYKGFTSELWPSKIEANGAFFKAFYIVSK